VGPGANYTHIDVFACVHVCASAPADTDGTSGWQGDTCAVAAIALWASEQRTATGTPAAIAAIAGHIAGATSCIAAAATA
jgi:hypothetical protein